MDQTLLKLQALSNEFENVKRHHYIPNSTVSESDVLHSYSVALLCWYIIETYGIDLDIAKVLKYALVHDLAEVHAGDTRIRLLPKKSAWLKKQKKSMRKNNWRMISHVLRTCMII